MPEKFSGLHCGSIYFVFSCETWMNGFEQVYDNLTITLDAES